MSEIEELLAAAGERLAAVVAWVPFGVPVGTPGTPPFSKSQELGMGVLVIAFG